MPRGSNGRRNARRPAAINNTAAIQIGTDVVKLEYSAMIGAYSPKYVTLIPRKNMRYKRAYSNTEDAVGQGHEGVSRSPVFSREEFRRYGV